MLLTEPACKGISVKPYIFFEDVSLRRHEMDLLETEKRLPQKPESADLNPALAVSLSLDHNGRAAMSEDAAGVGSAGSSAGSSSSSSRQEGASMIQGADSSSFCSSSSRQEAGGNHQGSGSVDIEHMRLRKCAQMLTRLELSSSAGAFLEPVDPVALAIPDYCHIITSPMDLGAQFTRFTRVRRYKC
jgi:hypothetical protein